MQMESSNRVYVILAGAALLAGMYLWSGHLRGQIDQRDGQVKILKEEASKLKEAAIQKDKAIEAATFRYEALKRTSDQKVAAERAIPAPPEAPPAPTTAEELTLTLRVALSPSAVALEDPNQASILNKGDAQKVYVYFEEAKRIPLFEAKTKAQEEAIVSLEATGKAAGDRFTLQGEALSLAGTRLANSEQQNQILVKEVRQVKTKGFLQKVLWGVAGVGVGYLAGKR